MTLPSTITDIRTDVFDNTAIVNNQTGVKYVGDWVVDFDDSLYDIEIKKGTKGIACGAFSINLMGSQIRNVTFPDSLQIISGLAFAYCKNLSEIILPTGLEEVRYRAFSYCTNLQKVTVLNPDCNLSSCTDTPSLNINNEQYSYQGWYHGTICGFDGSTAEEYANTCGYSFEPIRDPVYENEICGNDNLKWSFKDKTLTISGSGEMYNYKTDNQPWAEIQDIIQHVVIGDGVTNIGTYAFYGCKNIITVSIPSTATKIDKWAFRSCKSIEEITILNQNIEIEKLGMPFYSTGIIYGYAGSTAEIFANHNNWKFIDLENPRISGDMNLDNTLTVADVIFMQKYLLHKQSVTETQWLAGDMNHDGEVNIFDFCLLKRQLIAE